MVRHSIVFFQSWASDSITKEEHLKSQGMLDNSINLPRANMSENGAGVTNQFGFSFVNF